MLRFRRIVQMCVELWETIKDHTLSTKQNPSHSGAQSSNTKQRQYCNISLGHFLSDFVHAK